MQMSQSREGRVHVSNVSVGADGPFRCEVSADAPAFFTDYGAINIRVVGKSYADNNTGIATK